MVTIEDVRQDQNSHDVQSFDLVLEGKSLLPMPLGGYLSVSLARDESYIVSVPSFDAMSLFATKDSELLSQEDFFDKQGNHYYVTVKTDGDGVIWKLGVHLADRHSLEDIENHIAIEIVPNDY